jgi:hypothetical protein
MKLNFYDCKKFLDCEFNNACILRNLEVQNNTTANNLYPCLSFNNITASKNIINLCNNHSFIDDIKRHLFALIQTRASLFLGSNIYLYYNLESDEFKLLNVDIETSKSLRPNDEKIQNQHYYLIFYKKEELIHALEMSNRKTDKDVNLTWNSMNRKPIHDYVDKIINDFKKNYEKKLPTNKLF